MRNQKLDHSTSNGLFLKFLTGNELDLSYMNVKYFLHVKQKWSGRQTDHALINEMLDLTLDSYIEWKRSLLNRNKRPRQSPECANEPEIFPFHCYSPGGLPFCVSWGANCSWGVLSLTL